jgi:hypothetical protein
LKSVRVDKAHLIDTITANRTAHAETYRAACTGWHQTVLQALAEATRTFDDTEDTSVLNVGLQHQKPESHIADYDRALDMLKWELADVVELAEDDFRHFVQDDWDWTRHFRMSSAQYTAS